MGHCIYLKSKCFHRSAIKWESIATLRNLGSTCPDDSNPTIVVDVTKFGKIAMSANLMAICIFDTFKIGQSAVQICKQKQLLLWCQQSSQFK